jgi:hypothetical protein
VCSVEQYLPTAMQANELKTPRPIDVGEPAFNRVSCHADTVASRCFEQADGDKRVANLVFAW